MQEGDQITVIAVGDADQWCGTAWRSGRYEEDLVRQIAGLGFCAGGDVNEIKISIQGLYVAAGIDPSQKGAIRIRADFQAPADRFQQGGERRAALFLGDSCGEWQTGQPSVAAEDIERSLRPEGSVRWMRLSDPM